MKRAIWGVAAAIGVVAVGLVASLVAGGPASEGLATVSAASPPAGGGVTTTLTPSTSAASTTTLGQGVQPGVRRTTTSEAPATSSTTANPTTTVPATTTTTTIDPNVAPGPVCAPSMFSTTVTMSKPAYRVGDEVLATSVFRNVSGQACYLTSTLSGYKILDPSGEPATLPLITIGDHFRWVPVPAGATESENWTWDQRLCRPSVPCVPAVPGAYTFVVDHRPYGSGRATFDITA